MAKLFPKLDQFGGIATSQQGPVNTNVLTDYQAHKLGATRYGASAGGSAAQTVVAPGTNANGLILRSISVDATAGHFGLFADTAAPSSVTDDTKNKLLHVLNGTYLVTPHFPHVLIPAGVGLYWYSGAAAVRFWCSYDPL